MSWRAFIVVFLLPAVVLAQQPPAAPQPPATSTVPSPDRKHPPVEAIPPGEDQITPLKKGEPAPYSGQLFGVDTAIRWGNWLQQYRYRLVWDVELEQSICAEEKTYKDSLLSIEKQRAEKVEVSLRTALRESEKERLEAEEAARNPPWYSTMEFGVVVGAVAAVGVMAVAIWALEARNP